MPLHPFITQLIAATASRPALSAGTPAEGRAMVSAGTAVLGAGPPMHAQQDLVIPGRGGAVPARLYLPTPELTGIIVFLHGGGWVLGCVDDYDALCRTLARASGCAVLAPDYRLAPEHPYPAGLQDCEDVIRWLAQNRVALGLPAAAPLVLAGDSAGGNLATVAARRLAGQVGIALQVLLYPVTDCDFDRSSYRAHGQGLPLTARDMAWFFDHYTAGEDPADPAISPLRARDTATQPPAIVVTAEYDVLADEGRAYADQLAASGTSVRFRELPGLTHGFARLHNLLDVVGQEIDRIGSEIATALQGKPQ